jgi:hypothetical protein
MTPSRGRHCECAHITYVDDSTPITDCGDLEDGAPCSDGNGITANDACHAGTCESISWPQTADTQCAAFLPMNHNLVSLAAAEEACSADPACGGVSDLYCNGMYQGALDHYALCQGSQTTAVQDGTCAWMKGAPGGGGGGGH